MVCDGGGEGGSFLLSGPVNVFCLLMFEDWSCDVWSRDL